MSNELQPNDKVIVIGTDYIRLDMKYVSRIGYIKRPASPPATLLLQWQGPPGKWWWVTVDVDAGDRTVKMQDMFHELELVKLCR